MSNTNAEHADPAVAVPTTTEEQIPDDPISYSLTPTVHGVPVTVRLEDAATYLVWKLAEARKHTPGLSLADFVSDLLGGR